MGMEEVLGPNARPNPQFNFFTHFLIENRIMDIEPIKLIMAWRNKQTGEDRVAKRLDIFMISENILELPLHFRQGIGSGGEYDDSPI
jgi:hypothetical protein